MCLEVDIYLDWLIILLIQEGLELYLYLDRKTKLKDFDDFPNNDREYLPNVKEN